MKKKIKYTHPMKPDVTLEVVGIVERVEGDTTYVRRIDNCLVDFPTANITEETNIG